MRGVWVVALIATVLFSGCVETIQNILLQNIERQENTSLIENECGLDGGIYLGRWGYTKQVPANDFKTEWKEVCDYEVIEELCEYDDRKFIGSLNKDGVVWTELSYKIKLCRMT